MDQTFGKKEKLKSSIILKELFTKGKSINKYPLKLVYLKVSRPGLENHKIAVSVPKRNFKKAVERNFLKRLMREAFRKNKYLVLSNMTSGYAFMIIYIGKEKESYQRIFTTTEELLKKFVQREIK